MNLGPKLLVIPSASETWDEIVQGIPGWDVYWLAGYARFWERHGEGQACLAVLESGGERAVKLFLRRTVPGDSAGRWDLTSPYGYGGYLATPGAADLIPAFDQAFSEYCRHSGAVSEFIRFHPLLANHRIPGAPDVHLIEKGQTVWLDLTAGPPQQGYKSRVRNMIRKAQRSGLRVRLTVAPGDIARFLDLYRDTMHRRQAAPFFFFGDDCFAGLLRDLPQHLLLVEAVLGEQVVAAALFLFNGAYLHYHLGGADDAWLKLAPNSLIIAAAAEWGRERGIRLMHLGGGLRPGDSLFRFKAGFSPRKATFMVGQRIFDPGAYQELTEAHRAGLGGCTPAADYFPAYRAPAHVRPGEKGDPSE